MFMYVIGCFFLKYETDNLKNDVFQIKEISCSSLLGLLYTCTLYSHLLLIT